MFKSEVNSIYNSVTNQSNGCDLLSPSRGKAVSVSAIDSYSPAMMNEDASKLSTFTRTFEPSVPSTTTKNNVSSILGFFDDRVKDLEGEHEPFCIGDLFMPPQEGPDFSFGKSVPNKS